MAYNTAGESAQSAVTITVNNISASNLYINAGGPALTDSCNGVSWQADQFFTGGQAHTNPMLAACLGMYVSADTYIPRHAANIGFVCA